MGQQQVPVNALSRQASWFVLVGAAAAAVHFLMLLVLVRLGGIVPAWANVGAFAVAFCVSFGGHFRLTFHHHGTRRSWQSSLWRWLSSALLGFGLNQLLFVLGLHLFGQRWYVPVWLAVTLAVTVFTFVLGKFWAFGETDQGA